MRELAHALEGVGESVAVKGMSAWTDAALLNAAGIPAICFGPGDIQRAHTVDECVPVDDLFALLQSSLEIAFHESLQNISKEWQW